MDGNECTLEELCRKEPEWAASIIATLKASSIALWRISVGGGYGEFFYVGTEQEAEEMRAHKARWEAAVARKEKVSGPRIVRVQP
jgi:hypothetical protein